MTNKIIIRRGNPEDAEGVAHRLMDALVKEAKEQNVCFLMNMIDQANAKSREVHEHWGFTERMSYTFQDRPYATYGIDVDDWKMKE